MSDRVEWRWVDVGGVQYAVRFDELADALASEALPPFVLVWRTGWREWHRASSVPELRIAMAEASEPAAPIVEHADAGVPPAPPLERYAAVSAGPDTTLYQPKRNDPPPTVPPARPDCPAPPRPAAAGIPPPPAFMTGPIPIRDVMPTLAGEEHPVHSPTLRPAGATPPPPRTMPQSKVPLFEDVAIFEAEPVEEEAVEVLAPAAHAPPQLPPQLPPQPSVAEPPRFPEPSSPPVGPPARVAVPQGPKVAARTGGLSRNALTTLTSAGLVLPGTLLIAFALLHPRKHPTRAAAVASASPARTASVASAAAPPSVPPPPLSTGCTIAKSAQRLADTAYIGVPILFAPVPTEGQRVAVGFAAAKDHATGITIDSTTLAVTPAFDESVPDSTTLGVVPLVLGDKLRFAVDCATDKLASARTIDAKTRFAIGVSKFGFAMLAGDTASVIWPGKSKNPTITTPRVATIEGAGDAVTFRHGGQEGKVLLGWLRENGAKWTELKAVTTDAALVGTPTVSAGEDGVLVSFAAKATPDSAWRVELARANLGGEPEPSTVFALPPGGPGEEAIAPSAAGLSHGRYLLQWTEGSSGNRAIRAQVLGPDLKPMGDVLTLSAPEHNAGQGALYVHGETALALFFVQTASTHEIWGASLKCP